MNVRRVNPTLKIMRVSKQLPTFSKPQNSLFDRNCHEISNRYLFSIDKKLIFVSHLMRPKREKQSTRDPFQEAQDLPPIVPQPASSTTNTNVNTTTATSSRDSNAVRNLIQQQAANGSFNLTALQSQISKVTINDIDHILKELNVTVNEKTELILITVLVTLVFELKYANQKALWDLVVTKAKNWVKKEMVKENIKSDINLEEVGKKFLATHGISSF
jgi:hypothetical protein